MTANFMEVSWLGFLKYNFESGEYKFCERVREGDRLKIENGPFGFP